MHKSFRNIVWDFVSITTFKMSCTYQNKSKQSNKKKKKKRKKKEAEQGELSLTIMKCRKGNLPSTLKISAVEKIQSEVLKAIILEHLELSHMEIEGHH